MHAILPRILFAGIASLLLISPAFAADEAAAANVYLPIALEEGTWDADVTFYENDKPSGHAKGVQFNRLLVNGHWITNDFRIPATDTFPAYQGFGMWGYDPAAKTYVNTWIDTNDSSVRTDYGYWQAAEQIMTWSSKQNDGQGHFINYRMIEEFQGAARILTVYQLGIAKPNPHPLVRIVFAKRSSVETSNPDSPSRGDRP